MTAAVTPGKDHNATIVNGTYQTDIGETIIKSVCNDAGGYAVYAIGYSNDTEGDTDMYGSNGLKIPTDVLRPGEDQSSFWSMKLTAVTGDYAPEIAYAEDYAIVPETSTKVAYFEGTTDNNTGSSFKTTYAAYISPSQPAGVYVSKVLYRLVHPKPKEDITSLTYMQDINQNAIDDTEVGTTATLTDKRDNKSYTVAKLADGKVWMTQNLALGGSSTIELTPENTNLNTGTRFVLPVAQTSGSSNWDNGSDSQRAGARYVNGTEVTTGQNNDSNHLYAQSNTTYGNLYTYWTATAGSGGTLTSGDATESICPKGWRLPTGEDSGEQDALYTAYGSDEHNFFSGTSFAFSGYYYRGLDDQSFGGYWWSSSACDSNDAYSLNALSGGYVGPAYHSGRYVGNSVRCVAE